MKDRKYIPSLRIAEPSISLSSKERGVGWVEMVFLCRVQVTVGACQQQTSSWFVGYLGTQLPISTKCDNAGAKEQRVVLPLYALFLLSCWNLTLCYFLTHHFLLEINVLFGAFGIYDIVEMYWFIFIFWCAISSWN